MNIVITHVYMDEKPSINHEFTINQPLTNDQLTMN